MNKLYFDINKSTETNRINLIRWLFRVLLLVSGCWCVLELSEAIADITSSQDKTTESKDTHRQDLVERQRIPCLMSRLTFAHLRRLDFKIASCNKWVILGYHRNHCFDSSMTATKAMPVHVECLCPTLESMLEGTLTYIQMSPRPIWALEDLG